MSVGAQVDGRRGAVGRALGRSLAAVVAVAAVAASTWAGAQPATPPTTSEPVLPMVLDDVRDVGSWRIETWRPPDDVWAMEGVLRVLGPDGVVAYERRDAWVSAFEQAAGPGWRADLVALVAGDDLTGDGVPNVLVEAYSGGAHCCFSYALLSLGERVEVLWEGFLADAGVSAVDLRGDGSVQLMSADMSFAYAFCSFAETPAPALVLDVVADGVRIANLDFPEVYEREVAWALERVLTLPASAGPDSRACALAQLYLSLLYGGRADVAEAALERLFDGDDLPGFRAALWEILDGSPWFVAR